MRNVVPSRVSREGFHGEVDAECGSLSDRTIHLDGAAVGSNDAVADGQAQSGPFAHLLGGEEGVENPLQVFFGNSASRIDDRDLHHGHGLSTRFGTSGLRKTTASDGDGTP